MGVVYSQERIITVEGDTLYAKIIEVSDHAVSYKRYNYQEGATFVLGISKISSIIWENGEIDAYDSKTNILVTTNNNDNPINYTTTLFPAIVDRRRSNFILDNGTKMDEDEFELFMIANHVERYWKTYSSGKRLFKTGKILLIVGGSGATLGGAILINHYVLVVQDGSILERDQTNRNTGLVFFCTGMAVLTVALPLLITGIVKRNTFVDTYNERCAGKRPSEISENVLSWKLQPMANGLSVTLNF
jgi:hypothetical protein